MSIAHEKPLVICRRWAVLVVVLLASCQRPPFSDKIHGEWSGSTSDKKHSLRFLVKDGKIHELHISVNFAPPPAVMDCNFGLNFTPDAAVSGRDFRVQGTARGMLIGLSGRSDQGTVTVDLRGTFNTEDEASGELTLTLDQVPVCTFDNREHVLQWNAQRSASKTKGQAAPALPPPAPP